jgi:hypothetical protein
MDIRWKRCNYLILICIKLERNVQSIFNSRHLLLLYSLFSSKIFKLTFVVKNSLITKICYAFVIEI